VLVLEKRQLYLVLAVVVEEVALKQHRLAQVAQEPMAP
jgi:hypothetical protein